MGCVPAPNWAGSAASVSKDCGGTRSRAYDSARANPSKHTPHAAVVPPQISRTEGGNGTLLAVVAPMIRLALLPVRALKCALTMPAFKKRIVPSGHTTSNASLLANETLCRDVLVAETSWYALSGDAQ